MAIETGVAWYEGSALKRRLPEEEHGVLLTGWRHDFLPFYIPLLYGTMIGIVLGPATQKAMSVGTEPVIAIAAFAVAGHVSNLVSSFCSFTHQIVLNFYEQDKRKVWWLTASLSVLSTLVLSDGLDANRRIRAAALHRNRGTSVIGESSDFDLFCDQGRDLPLDGLFGGDGDADRADEGGGSGQNLHGQRLFGVVAMVCAGVPRVERLDPG